MKTIMYVLIGLVGLIMLMAGYTLAFFGGAAGWPFWAAYLPAVVVLAVAVRLPNFSKESMVESTVEGQRWLMAYILPITYPVFFYAIGRCVLFVVDLFGIK